jgi:hypothetical protein
MEKSRIFIASSGRTLVLAEKLRDELQTDFCEATLWSEEGRRQPGATIIEMLETSAEHYDFAVIILARDDVLIKETGDTLKARDNCVFEAGLFMKSLGRERCFLVNSVDQRDLPSDLGGVISLPFKEPSDLFDRDACAQAIKSVSAAMKDSVQRAGKSARYERLPILSIDDVLFRERPQSDGGDLREGQVVVCDLQPNPGAGPALHVRRNLDRGVSYTYFLHFTDDTLDKIFQGLQMLVAGGSDASAKAPDFSSRLGTIDREKERVLDDLRMICRARSLIISFLPDAPQFCFRCHNASDSERARLYLRFRATGFMPWLEGAAATSLWKSIPNFISMDEEERIFVPMKHLTFEGEAKRRFENSLKRGLNRYFPGMQDEVRRLCIGTET